MPNPVGSLTRAATRRPGEPLNILTFPTHEAYEVNLCATGHRFFAYRGQGIKDWNAAYRPVPENYTLLNAELGDGQLPTDIDFDLVFSQNKWGQYPVAKRLARLLQLPLVTIEHTLPHPDWNDARRKQNRQMGGDLDVFISGFSRKGWRWGDDEAEVIHHGIDTKVFSPNDNLVRKKAQVLSVVNDWMNRDWCCGFKLWEQVAKGLPVCVVGATPGLSEPAKSVQELVKRYRESQVFLNTSLISPVPTALLEAMACGCAVVSTATCMIPEVIENGVNGFISNDPAELRKYVEQLLDDKDLCKKLGQAARQTILERFTQEQFVARWNEVFHKAASFTFTG